jgi:hypothetical protein
VTGTLRLSKKCKSLRFMIEKGAICATLVT